MFATPVPREVHLAALGLHELIAAGLDDDLERATRFATDPGALAEVRARLAVARHESPLFDTAARVQALEVAFAATAEQAGAGLPPAAMEVARRGASVAFVK